MKLLTLETILDFGYYKGEQIEDLIYDQPDFIRMLVEDENYTFDDDAKRVLHREKFI